MKKIFYKLFILGGLLTSTTLISNSKSGKKDIAIPNVPDQKEMPKEKATPLPVQKEAPELKEEEAPKTTPQAKTIETKEGKKSKYSSSLLTFLRTLPPLVKKTQIFPHINEIKLPSKEEFKTFIEHQKQLLKEEELASRYSFIRHLMAPTYLIESTRVDIDENNIVHSLPMECFYFCESNALTIGYGLKIEFNGKKLAPEGIAALESLDIKVNGRSLSQQEKEDLAYQCINKRDAYDKKHSPNLSQMRYEAQREILFPNGQPSISKENALASMQIEYTDKLERLLRRNPFLGNSFYSQSLGTDLAYQYGNGGVTNCNYYKQAKNKVLSSTISAGKDDRLKIRKYLCALAYRYHQDTLKRKGAQITQEEQNAFTLFALQKYFELFKNDIMQRSAHHIMLLENFMTLVMMQHQQDLQEIPLRSFQIVECEQKAHKLVYHDLFHSSPILQLPKKIRPITMVDAIKGSKKSLDAWMKPRRLSLKPEEFMEKILFEEAEKKIKVYNKKNKKSISIKRTPSRPNIARNKGSER